MKGLSLNRITAKLFNHQFLRYLLVGGASWLVDFGIFYLTYALIGIIPAQTIARIVGALVGFAGHKTIVFNDRGLGLGKVHKQAVLYVSLWVISYAISIGLLMLLINLLGLHPIASKLITETVIVFFNFVTMKHYIFVPRAGA